MIKERRNFTDEFKLEVARMVVDQGMAVPTVCKDMKLGATVMRRWADQYKAERRSPRHRQAAHRSRQSVCEP